MMLTILVVLVFVCSVGPAVLFVVNLRSYKEPEGGNGGGAGVAVLIPARNEEANIGECVQRVLDSGGPALEVFVLDDASTDRTAAIVREIAAADERVRLLSSKELPAGWNGKQHACWQLALASSSPLMLFLDADVRLHFSAIGKCVAERERRDVALLSGFPRQTTVGFLEWMLLPLIHFVLLGFLPLKRMRKTTDPAMAAGCGQFLLVEREAYFASGGHEAIRTTMHDGLLLPRAFRRAGFSTDLVDLTNLAEVRMYDSAAKVWLGLAKNATEGIAAPKRIVPITVMLLLGQVVPIALVPFWVLLLLVVGGAQMNGGLFWTPWLVTCTASIAVSFIASFVPRLLAMERFNQPAKSALLHPVGIFLLLCVQWYALARQVMGKPVGWRAREYASGGGEEVS